MSIALDPRTSRRFITEGDLELKEELQTWWKVRDLSQRERVTYMNGLSLRDGGTGNMEIGGTGTRIYIAMKSGLEGYEEDHPLRGSDGKAVPFTKDPDGSVSDEFLERVDWREQRELADEITRNMTLVGRDLEKSAPSPTDS